MIDKYMNSLNNKNVNYGGTIKDLNIEKESINENFFVKEESTYLLTFLCTK